VFLARLGARTAPFALLFLAVLGPLAGQTPLRLIAHRGGIVDDRYAENSSAAVEAAIARGYWMLEVGVRESKDGKLVAQHDPDFNRFFRVTRAKRSCRPQR